MDGIEKITGRIAADTEAEIASIQAEARRQADEITARYEAQAKREAEEIAARGRRSAEERQAALVLSRAIFAGKAAVETGERDASALKALMGGIIEAEPLARIDYVEVVDGVTMQPTDAIGAVALVAMAVYIGSTRLIDNFLYEAHAAERPEGEDPPRPGGAGRARLRRLHHCGHRACPRGGHLGVREGAGRRYRQRQPLRDLRHRRRAGKRHDLR